MVERFDLLVIIVLGEVVVGVVNGLSDADHDPMTLATGFLALMVGFGLWWIFFDVGGRRLPRFDGLAVNAWMAAHLPIAVAIIGAGAAMVGLIEHAHDPQTPAPTAWLLAGSVALGLIALGLMTRTLADYGRHVAIYRPLAFVMVGAAGVALLLGWWRPTPWLLALLLAAILAAIWLFAVVRLFKTGTWTASGASGTGGRAASGGLKRGEVCRGHERTGLAVGTPADALELAPETLAGSALPARGRDVRSDHRHHRRAVVDVAGRGDGGPDPRLDRPHDLDDPLAVRDERLHPIARPDLRRRLRRRSVHKDVAALARPRRQRASLHEAHSAQPAIDARLVDAEVVTFRTLVERHRSNSRQCPSETTSTVPSTTLIAVSSSIA